MEGRELEILQNWLRTFPKWEQGGFDHIDFADGAPGSTGLYTEGLEEPDRTVDVTGCVWVRNRWSFSLYRVARRQEDNRENARWLMDFQTWVQQQSAAGLAPIFGDLPYEERIFAGKGKLKRSEPSGSGMYAVLLQVEFVKRYSRGDENAGV